MNEQDVYKMKQIAYVFSQSVAALAVIEGMKALNADRDRRGETQGYTEESFYAVVDQFGLGHNAVINTLAAP